MRALGLILLVSAPAMAQHLACGSYIGRVNEGLSFQLFAGGGVEPYTYSAGGSIPGMSLNASTGVLSGTPTTVGHFTTAFSAKDANGATAQATCGVAILPPAPQPSCALLPAANPGQLYSGKLSPQSNGIAVYSWSLVSGDLAGVALLPNGTLTGIPTGMTAITGTFAVSDVLISTSGAQVPTVTCTIPVLPQLTIGCGTEDLAVSVKASGGVTGALGTAPYSFTFEGPAIPGLTLASNGSWTGTPTTPGIYAFALKANDGGSGIGRQSAFTTCRLRIAPVDLQVYCDNLPLAHVGQGYSSAGVKVTGGIPPYLYSLETIPVRWLSIDPKTGVLSGTPPIDLPFPFTIRVTDNGGVVRQSKSAACQINTPSPETELTSFCGTLPIGTLKNGYTGTVLALGGTPPYLWRLHESYIAGLKLSTSGIWSGMPTFAGNWPFEAQVTDTKGVTDTVQCSITVQKTLPPVVAASASAELMSRVDATVTLAAAAASRVTGAMAAQTPDGGDVSIPFAIDAGADSAQVSAGSGTVAGEMTLSLSRLVSDEGDQMPEESVSAVVRIARAAPRLVRSSARVEGGMLRVMGVSNTREVLDADVTWTFADGTSRTVRVDLAELSAAWFASEAGRRGVFEVAVPVEEGAVGASVVVRNGEGGSEAVSAR